MLEMFDLTDRELDELWVLQRDATVLLSVGATCACLSFGLWLETLSVAADDEAQAAAGFLVDVGMPLFALLGVLFAVLGFFALKRRRGVMAAIGERRRKADAGVTRLEDSPEPGIVAAPREPSRTLLRW